MTNVKPTFLPRANPSQEALARLENVICEERARETQLRRKLPADFVVNLEEKHVAAWHGASAFLNGIQVALTAIYGQQAAEFFISRAASKHERVQAAQDAQGPKPKRTTSAEI